MLRRDDLRRIGQPEKKPVVSQTMKSPWLVGSAETLTSFQLWLA